MKRVTTLLLLALFALAAGGCDSNSIQRDTVSSGQQERSTAVEPAPGRGSGESGHSNSGSAPHDRGDSSNTPVTPVKSDEGPKVH